MKLSIFERILKSSRPRSKLQPEILDPTPPVIMQNPSDQREGPWLTTTSKGAFVQTRLNNLGYVGQAFSDCPIDEEDLLFSRFFQTICKISKDQNWGNRADTIEDAMCGMVELGFEPKALIVPYCDLLEVTTSELSEEEVEHISLQKGCVTEVLGVKVISGRATLPKGSALLVADSSLLGYYTRILNYVAVTTLQSDRTIFLVGHALVG